MPANRAAADRLLGHLGLTREPPTRDYLDRLIRAHQLRVPFETLSKLIDYEAGLRRGDFLPTVEEYVERLVTRGAGGTCWTLARGFHCLLIDLGFDAALMVMVPGHCCVRVELADGSFYADVGFAAPIFRAYPLFESFALDTPRERFVYDVRPDGIFVTRHPGPSKQLDPAPRRIEELGDLVRAANDWSPPHSFLRRLAWAAYVDGVYTSLNDGVLRRYRPAGVETTELGTDAATDFAAVFAADPALYREAEEVRRRWLPPG